MSNGMARGKGNYLSTGSCVLSTGSVFPIHTCNPGVACGKLRDPRDRSVPDAWMGGSAAWTAGGR